MKEKIDVEEIRDKLRDSYDYIGLYSEGMFAVKKNNEYYHILISGEKAYKEIYNNVGSFSQGLAWAEKNGKQFHIKTSGEPAYEDKFDWVGSFDENGLTRAIKDKREFHINKEGKPIYDKTFRKVSVFFSDKDGNGIYALAWKEVEDGNYQKLPFFARRIRTERIKINIKGEEIK